MSDEEVLVMGNSVILRVLEIGLVFLPQDESVDFPHGPESSTDPAVVVAVITDGMQDILGPVEELLNRPPIPPVHETVCIANHHEIDPRFVDRTKSLDHVDGPQLACMAKDDIGVRLQEANVRRVDIGRKVDPDFPVREMLLGDLDVLDKRGIIPGIGWAIETERKGVYHSLLSTEYDFG
jgi:hypothetical protein